MKTTLPTITNNILIDGALKAPVDSPAWFAWLEGAASFSWHGITCRNELRRGRRGYWYAYRRIDGKLCKIYLGQSHCLTVAVMTDKAQKLFSPPALQLPAQEEEGPGFGRCACGDIRPLVWGAIDTAGRLLDHLRYVGGKRNRGYKLCKGELGANHAQPAAPGQEEAAAIAAREARKIQEYESGRGAVGYHHCVCGLWVWKGPRAHSFDSWVDGKCAQMSCDGKVKRGELGKVQANLLEAVLNVPGEEEEEIRPDVALARIKG